MASLFPRSPIRSFTLIICMLPAHWALAQNTMRPSDQPSSPANDFIRRQAEQDLQLRLNTLGTMTPRQQSATRAPPAVADKPADKAPCFAITAVQIDGVSVLSERVLAPVLAKYRGQCINSAAINHLLKDVTALYLDAGYITARLYVPEQNIGKSKILRLVAAEGSLADIYLNGQPAENNTVLRTAFPALKNKPVNIRDIEQGLDQINRLSSNHAKSSMLPGKQADQSILNIDNKPDLPWHFALANNNLGQKSTGYSRSSIAFRMDNLLNLNDLVALSFEHSGPDYPLPDDGVGQSNSLSGSVSMPYGSWTFSFNGSYYKYRSTVPGNFGIINTSGKSSQLGFNAERVIWRDKNAITTLNAGFNYKRTDNFLMGSLIEVGSRQYSVANVAVSHSRRMFGGLWLFDLGYQQGLGVFGATKRGSAGAGAAEPKFKKFTAALNVSHPLAIANQSFQLTSLITGQYSPDPLYGAEQLSLGSFSNVRGSRDSLLFGNSGLFTRNEIAWRLQPWHKIAVLNARLGELRPYAALDYGHVFAQSRLGISGGDIASWTLGTRLVGGTISADIGYSRLFKIPAETAAKDLFFVSTSLQW